MSLAGVPAAPSASTTTLCSPRRGHSFVPCWEIMLGEDDSMSDDMTILRVVLDTNGFDNLADDDEILACVEEAVAAGRVELITLPDLLAEVAAIPDREKAERLGRLTTTAEYPVAVWGVTAWGEAVWGDNEIAATFDDATGHNFSKHYVDAQALITAQRLGLPLVTADKKLIGKARRNGVPTMSTAEVLAAIRGRLDDSQPS